MTVLLTAPLNDQSVADKTNLQFVINARVGVDIIDNHVVIIDVPKEVCKQVTVFVQPMYKGALMTDLTTLEDMEEIRLTPDINYDEIDISLGTDCKLIFNINLT